MDGSAKGFLDARQVLVEPGKVELLDEVHYEGSYDTRIRIDELTGVRNRGATLGDAANGRSPGRLNPRNAA
jgi:hypothetical protein